jgi:hypothetical protein
MPNKKKPLKPDDFPLEVDQEKIKTSDGKTIAKTDSEATAQEIAERLNEDEEKKEEDRWSA